MRTHRLAPLALALACTFGAPSLLAQSSLRMTAFVDLGVPGNGLGSFAYGINQLGQIVGDTYDAQGDGLAFRYEDTMRTFAPSGGYRSSAGQAINASGVIAGSVYHPLQPDSRQYSQAAVIRNGAVTLLGALDPSLSAESFAKGINDVGQVVGSSNRGIDPLTQQATPFRAFLHSGGGMSDMGTLGGDASGATAINNHGQVVGWAHNAQGVVRAFVFSGGTMSELGGLGGSSRSFANAINDQGQIVGSAMNQAFLFSGGAMHSLGRPGEFYSEALGINGLGQVVGFFQNQDRQPRLAFLHSGGERHNLNTLAESFLAGVQGTGMVSLVQAHGINDQGQIVGQGLFRDAQGNTLAHAFAAVVKRLSFVWEGSEGFAFDHAANWSDGYTPQAADTVLLSELGSKRIQLAPGSFVSTDKLFVLGGSDTAIDLGGGLWQVGAEAREVDPLSRLRLTGGVLAVGNGTLVVFDDIRLRNDGFGNSELHIGAGGRVFARGDKAVSVGDVGGLFESVVSVTGQQALLDSHSLFVGDRGVGSLQVRQGGMVLVGQNLYVGVDGVGSVLVSDPGSLIAITASGGGPAPSGGSAALRAAAGAPTFGEVRIGLRQAGSLTVANGASLSLQDAQVFVGDVGAAGTLAASGAGSLVSGGEMLVRDEGLVVVRQGASFITSRKLEIQGGAVFLESGAAAATDEVFINGGVLSLDASALSTSRLSLFGGTISLTGNSRLVVLADQPLVVPGGNGSARIAGGALSIEGGSELKVPLLTLGPGARLSGRGTIVGTVINEGGTIEPGQSPGVLTIAGDYQQLGGRLVLEIAGLLAGSQHDVLRVNGGFSFEGGVVELAFSGGFAPSTGERFALLDIAGVGTGSFSFAVSGLQPGWQFSTSFDSGDGQLWLTSENNGVAAVPEPSALLLMALGLAWLAAPRLRRRAGN